MRPEDLASTPEERRDAVTAETTIVPDAARYYRRPSRSDAWLIGVGAMLLFAGLVVATIVVVS